MKHYADSADSENSTDRKNAADSTNGSAFRRSLQPPNILLDPAVCLVVILEFFLIAFERRRVDVAAAVDRANGMDNVEHLVENDVIDDISRDVDRIERTADRDVVERAVVVAEDAKRLSCGPGKCRFWDLAAEIVAVQRVEDRIEIIDRSLCRGHNFPTAFGFVRSRFFANKIGLDVGVVNLAGTGRNFLSKQFANENIGKAFVTRQRHFAANVADANVDLAFADADRMIYADIRIK